MVWKWDSYKCHGVYIRSICIFSALDLPWLLKRPELIANKFNASFDALVLDCLERSLEQRAEQGFREVRSAGGLARLVSTLDWAYYRALPHLRGSSRA